MAHRRHSYDSGKQVQVAKRLKQIGLEQYAPNFDSSQITVELWPSLDHEFLSSMGVDRLADRSSILSSWQKSTKTSMSPSLGSSAPGGEAPGVIRLPFGVEHWLKDLGLAKYWPHFQSHHINEAGLLDLDRETLHEVRC
jgi:hypothetical protein